MITNLYFAVVEELAAQGLSMVAYLAVIIIIHFAGYELLLYLDMTELTALESKEHEEASPCNLNKGEINETTKQMHKLDISIL